MLGRRVGGHSDAMVPEREKGRERKRERERERKRDRNRVNDSASYKVIQGRLRDQQEILK